MDHNSATDSELIAEALAANREAFGQLYDRHARMVRAVVAGVSGDWPAADDMVQESFLRAYRNLATLRDPNRFGQWIVGIARQVGRERRRALRRDRHEFHDARTWEIESVEKLEPEVHLRDDAEHLMNTLVNLSEQERLAIHVFYLQQQDRQQAAELLGLSRSGFYALVQRSVAKLANLLQPRTTKERTKN